MLKKVLALIFAIATIYMPVYAYTDVPHGAKYPLIIKAEFNTNLNINKSSANQAMQFVSSKTYTDERTEFTIPKGTIFNGKIRSAQKSKWAFRRANAIIDINEMRFPNGDIYTISANTKKFRLKGSPIINTVKGLIGTPFAIVAGTAGTCLIIVETVSIIGIASVEPTAKATGKLVNVFTKGINYKKNDGASIKLKINNIREYDIEREVQGTIVNQDKTDSEPKAEENDSSDGN